MKSRKYSQVVPNFRLAPAKLIIFVAFCAVICFHYLITFCRVKILKRSICSCFLLKPGYEFYPSSSPPATANSEPSEV